MTILIAAVVLVGALCLFDLLLTFAVLRRLREHSEKLAAVGGAAGHGLPGAPGQRPFVPYDPSVLVGTTLPQALTEAGEGGARVVAFFDAQCETCHDHAPEFAARVRGRNAVAVISGRGSDVDALVRHVEGVAFVLRGEQARELVEAVAIEAFPTFVEADGEGAVVRAVTDPQELPAPGAAPASAALAALAEPAPTA
ncbi:hypothetical protein AB0M39_29925 [Streptomyces sp. NPDC051907]|uniref:hypothetical protein n=1 Tax=Streptomyces sp. NPDC051907 TaxID=3155284 RepID=UPI0034474B5E